MSDNKRRSTAVWIGLISTWFGSHVGAGFATGSQYVVYYGEYGWYSIFTPFVTWAIVGAVFYIIYEYCRLIGATSYKDYAKNFYLPQNKIVSGAFVLLFDLWLVLAQIIGLGGIMAGGGSMFESTFGIPYWAGIVIVGLVIAFMVVFGMNFLMKTQKYMMYVLWALILTISFIGLSHNMGNLQNVVVTRQSGFTVFQALKAAFTYAALRMAVMGATSPIAGRLSDSRETRKGVILGAIVNGVMLWLFGLFILSMYPEGNSYTLPVLTGIQNLGPAYRWLEILYAALLFFALVTTGAGCCFTMSSRFGPVLHKKIQSETLCRVIIIVVLLGIGSYFSSWGLYKVFSKGYGYLAKIAQPMVLYPAVLLGPYRIWQLRHDKGVVARKGVVK